MVPCVLAATLGAPAGKADLVSVLVCCNGSDVFLRQPMGVAIYLGLVAAGLVAAFLLSTVLRGIKLI